MARATTATVATLTADERLLDTAIDQFGRHGFDGASTRAIAAAAGTAMSSITYHYGGKDGLYRAAARHIAHGIRRRMTAPMAAAFALGGDGSARGASEALLAILDGFAEVLTSGESEAWARFIVREQMAPTAAFEILYAEVMAGMAAYITTLLLRIGEGRIGEAEAQVKALAIFGQILVFRVARATVLHVTGWADVTPVEADEIKAVVRANTRAILESLRGDRP
ncbi:transcriptional regulator, TetR family [Sphingomonas laterariae]|uniref:Transcriptional regulator, TetR family n=1 Tax=Edaphosphingomonas laterariae TaxID=861865 RepID=A0A239HEA8_9SPHN|nr:CerR family C-terminal domain-containing protein [Sphingomonas laterariae]SNS79475.1 transcriptional regulator, TetR family [Sphingomonas laterariae]